MSDESQEKKARGRVITITPPTGEEHIATRAVVLKRKTKKAVKTLPLTGRKITTRPWKARKAPKSPPSIGSMQPPGKKSS